MALQIGFKLKQLVQWSGLNLSGVNESHGEVSDGNAGVGAPHLHIQAIQMASSQTMYGCTHQHGGKLHHIFTDC